MSTTVTYKDNTLTTVNNATKTLKTAGKYMEDDITLVDDSITGSVYQDGDGYLVIDDSESTAPQGTLSITANGTYDIADYAGASVNVSDPRVYRLITRSGTSFSVPSTVTSIGSYAFAGWSSLTQLTWESPVNVNNILPSAFENCTGLTEIVIPSKVSQISEYGFRNCSSLTTLTFSDTLTSLGSSSFSGCSALVSVEGNGAMRWWNPSVFNYCSSLERAIFPNAVCSSLSSTFGGSNSNSACKKLEILDIGSTASIDASALANCYALETLILRKSDSICTLTNVSAFTNTPMRGYNSLTGTIYVPQALISTYQTATNWSTLYSAGTVTFAAIEGSEYERD